MKILVVDDDPFVLQSCQRVLAAEGLDAHTAATVTAATTLLAGQAFDLMITDINMPGQNGFAMIQTAKAMAPHMPILVMTGYLTPETVETCLRLGAVRHIAKPFTPAELLAAIEIAHPLGQDAKKSRENGPDKAGPGNTAAWLRNR